VPHAVDRTLAQARTAMDNAGLPSRVADGDPRGPGAVVVGQEPPAGAWVPPGSPVGFRTRTHVWPNGVPRRLRLGEGRTTAAYRIVAADPVHDAFEVVLSLPRGVDLGLWLRTTTSRREVLGSTQTTPLCRPAGRRVRCLLAWPAQQAEAPGIWTIGAVKHSSAAAVVRVRVTFTRP
jgi:hypothetical protein